MSEAGHGPPVVLVTGCSTGLGRHSALYLARRGGVVVAAVRDSADAPRLAAQARAEGLDLRVTQIDVCDPESVSTGLAMAEGLCGPLDVLVNNAGVEIGGPLEHTADDELAWQLETNVAGTFRMTRAALRGMRERGRGRLIFVSSLLDAAPWPFSAAHAASKFAVEGMAQALRWELMPFGIAVSVVRPGRFPSALSRNLRRVRGYHEDSPYRRYDAEFRAALARVEPAGYSPEPAQVARRSMSFVEVRGEVAGTVTGERARRYLDELSLVCQGTPYDPSAIRSERVILRIAPRRCLLVTGRTYRTLVVDLRGQHTEVAPAPE